MTILTSVPHALAIIAPPPSARPAYMDGMVDYEVKRLSTVSGPYATFSELFNDNLNWSTSNPPNQGDAIRGVIDVWDGGVGIPSEHALVGAGSGHQVGGWNGFFGYVFAGTTEPLGFVLEAGSLSDANIVPFDTTQHYIDYPDGRPSGRHTYDGLVYDPVSDEIMLFGGSVWYQGGVQKDTWKFKRAENAWTTMGEIPDWPLAAPNTPKTAWDADTRKVWLTSRSAFQDRSSGFFDSANNTWSANKPFPLVTPQDGEETLIYDSRRKIAYILNSNMKFDLDFVAETVVQGTWGPPTGTGTNIFTAGNTAYFDRHPTDPALDRFWVFAGFGVPTPDPGFTNIVEMNATTFVCTNHVLTGDSLAVGIPADFQGNYDRAVWMPDWGFVGTVVDHELGACVIKLPLYSTASPLLISVSSNGRYLQDGLGQPWLMNGDTAWTLPNALSRAELTTYFADCQTNGFNTVLFEMIQTSYSAGNPPNNAEGNAPFLTPGDFTTPNELYWEYIDYLVAEAAAHGIVLGAYPAYVGQSDGWVDEFSSDAEMTTYGTFIGNRYKDSPNIIWWFGGDADPAASSKTSEHNALANAVKAADPNHIATAHPARNLSAFDTFNEGWRDANATYSNVDTVLTRTEVDWNRIGTASAMVLMEGDYQGSFSNPGGLDEIDDQAARGQAYQHILGGGSGHIYGHHSIWEFLSDYVTQLAQPGRTSMLYLKNLFDSRPYHDLVPDWAHTLITAGYDQSPPGNSIVMGALGNGGDTLLAYFPNNSYTITVDMSQIGGTDSDAHWFNPRDGSASLDGNYSNSGTRQFTPPSAGDWVLVIDNDALSLGAPG